MNELSEGQWDFTIWQYQRLDEGEPVVSGWNPIAKLEDFTGDYLHDGNFDFNPKFQILALL